MEWSDECGAYFLSAFGGMYVCHLPKGHGDPLHLAHGVHRGYPYSLRWQGDYRDEGKSFLLTEEQQLEFVMLCHRKNIPWTADFDGEGELIRFFVPGVAAEKYRVTLATFMRRHGVETEGDRNGEITPCKEGEKR